MHAVARTPTSRVAITEARPRVAAMSRNPSLGVQVALSGVPPHEDRRSGAPHGDRERTEVRDVADSQLGVAIWMRLPQVSSSTAVVTGPIAVGS